MQKVGLGWYGSQLVNMSIIRHNDDNRHTLYNFNKGDSKQ